MERLFSMRDVVEAQADIQRALTTCLPIKSTVVMRLASLAFELATLASKNHPTRMVDDLVVELLLLAEGMLALDATFNNERHILCVHLCSTLAEMGNGLGMADMALQLPDIPTHTDVTTWCMLHAFLVAHTTGDLVRMHHCLERLDSMETSPFTSLVAHVTALGKAILHLDQDWLEWEAPSLSIDTPASPVPPKRMQHLVTKVRRALSTC
jgi:hypothetical protein